MDQSPREIAVFDIDGTLLHSAGTDDACYVQAVGEVFGVRGFSTDWSRHRYSTDSGIAHELVRAERGHPPTVDELAAFRTRFEQLLHAEHARAPDGMRPVAGGRELVDALRAAGWAVAVATGSWRCTATWKLALAGLDPAVMPLATADDALDRPDIVRIALQRALERHLPPADRGAACRAVYVGDGVWDFLAAQTLGIGFVGVTTREAGKHLRAAGVTSLVDDLAGGAESIALLKTATRRYKCNGG